MSMNGDVTPQDETLRQARLAVEALATDMARSLFEASLDEGDNQVNFLVNHFVRLYVMIADLKASNMMLQERLNNPAQVPVESSV